MQTGSEEGFSCTSRESSCIWFLPGAPEEPPSSPNASSADSSIATEEADNASGFTIHVPDHADLGEDGARYLRFLGWATKWEPERWSDGSWSDEQETLATQQAEWLYQAIVISGMLCNIDESAIESDSASEAGSEGTTTSMPFGYIRVSGSGARRYE